MSIVFVVVVIFTANLVQHVDISCKSVEIMCTYVPDTGSHTTFVAEQKFSLLNGCEMKLSVDNVIDECAALLGESSSEEMEEVDFDIVEEEYMPLDVNDTYAADVAAELDSLVELQVTSDANPQLQADSLDKR